MFYYYPKLKISIFISWKYLKKESKYRIDYKLSRKSENGLAVITHKGEEEWDREQWRERSKVLLSLRYDGNIASGEAIDKNPDSMNLAKHLFVLAGKKGSLEMVDEINKLWRKEVEGAAPTSTEIFINTEKVVSYGPASGMDISIGSETRKFRLHDDDFLSPKNFRIWYTSEFGRMPEISSQEWKEMIEGWMSMSERKTSIEDDLVPSIWEDFTETLRMNTIYDEFSEDLLENLKTSNVSEFVLLGRSLYVYNRIYEHLKTKFDVKARKLREYFLPFLAESSTKVIHRGEWQGRFWMLDWKKLTEGFPALKEFEAKVVHVEEKNPEDFDVRCKACGKAVILDLEDSNSKSVFMDDHIAQHQLKEPESAEEYASFLKDHFEFYEPITAPKLRKVSQ